jgi:hypothetical protein
VINLAHSLRVFVHTPPTDLRKGFDALSGLVTTAFGQDPTCGHLFLFIQSPPRPPQDPLLGSRRRTGHLVQEPDDRLPLN